MIEQARERIVEAETVSGSRLSSPPVAIRRRTRAVAVSPPTFPALLAARDGPFLLLEECGVRTSPIARDCGASRDPGGTARRGLPCHSDVPACPGLPAFATIALEAYRRRADGARRLLAPLSVRLRRDPHSHRAAQGAADGGAGARLSGQPVVLLSAGGLSQSARRRPVALVQLLRRGWRRARRRRAARVPPSARPRRADRSRLSQPRRRDRTPLPATPPPRAPVQPPHHPGEA